MACRGIGAKLSKRSSWIVSEVSTLEQSDWPGGKHSRKNKSSGHISHLPLGSKFGQIIPNIEGVKNPNRKGCKTDENFAKFCEGLSHGLGDLLWRWLFIPQRSLNTKDHGMDWFQVLLLKVSEKYWRSNAWFKPLPNTQWVSLLKGLNDSGSSIKMQKRL